MNAQWIAARFLRAAGMLLITLGLVHIAASPHIPDLLRGSPPAVYERAVGPTLLNHVLVGILLLPLGYTTWLAAASGERNEALMTRILIANTTATFALPISLVVFMRRPEYYSAPFFLTGVGLVAIVSLLLAAATWIRVRGRRWQNGTEPPH
jgi:hypothetical protein